MKKYLLFIAMIMALAIVFTSCKFFGFGGGDSTGDNSGGNTDDGSGDNSGGSTDTGDSSDDDGDVPEGFTLIFKQGRRIALVNNKANGDYPDTMDRVSLLRRTIGDKIGVLPILYTDSQTVEQKNEIVIGDTDRDITAKAHEILSARIKSEIRKADDEDFAMRDLVGYTVYASGGDLAVVWSDFRMEESAFSYFIENYIIDTSLVLKEGYSKTVVVSLSEFLADRGEQVKDAAWAELEANLPENYSTAIVSSLKQLYSLYTVDMVYWLANLGDPETGGFYHSNSARDNHGFLPDIENTYVATGFIEQSGLAEMRYNDWTNVIPDWWKERMGNWIYEMQDPDTFFYHPQWPKEFIIAGDRQSRITRDRSSAKEILKDLGISWKYTNYLPSEDALTDRLGGDSIVAAVSKVVPTSGMLSQYDSVDNYRAYLAELEESVEAMRGNDSDFAYRLYWIGNQLQSSVNYIKADTTGQMAQMTIDFFNKYQNPETGMWDTKLGYNSTNGLHKIASVLNALGAELDYTDKMIDSIIEVLSYAMEDEWRTAGAGVDIYNAWSGFAYVYHNVENFGSGSIEERRATVDAYKDKVYSVAAHLVSTTYTQIAGFRRDDGSFGYTRVGSCPTAQGCPAAVSGVHEGDVNGNQIASGAIVQYVLSALEVYEYMPPFFTEYECNEFVYILENLGAIIKNSEAVDEDLYIDFEKTDIGAVPEEMSVTRSETANEIPGTYAHVVDGGKNNKVLEYVAKSCGSDPDGRNYALNFNVPNVSPVSNMASLSFDIKFSREGSDVSQQLIQFYVYDTSSPVLAPTFRMSASGEIWLYSAEGVALCSLGMADEWIDFRLEYYWDEGVYKVYSDGIFKASSTETYNNRKHNKVVSATFGTPSTVNSKFQLDEVHFNRNEKKYIDGSRELLDEKIYNFNSQKIPGDIVASGDYSFEASGDGYALKSEGASFGVPTNLRSYLANSTVVEFDMSVLGTAAADTVVATVDFINDNGAAIWKLDIGVDARGKLYFANNATFAEKTATNISASAGTKIRAVAYYGAGTSKCDNLIMVYAGDSENAACYSLTMSAAPNSKIAATSATISTPAGAPAVLLDNLRVERTVTSYENPFTYPTVTPGSDKPLLDFEDANVGTKLPSRVSGDATVGIELDGSNRFLQLVDDSKSAEYSALIDFYTDSTRANKAVVDLEVELLTGSSGDMLYLTLVDASGNEEQIFVLRHAGYASTLVLRPYTIDSYSAAAAEQGLWKWSIASNNLDSTPKVVSRENLQNGLIANSPAISKVKVTLEIDCSTKKVKLTYNLGGNTIYSTLGDTVYTTSLSSIKSLKLTTGVSSTSVINIDNVRAESYYTTPPTYNTSPSHGFDGKVNGADINGYIQNGAQVDLANGSVKFAGTDDVYLSVDGSSDGSNPSVTIPAYTATGITANKATVRLDIDARALLSDNSVRIQLLNKDGKGLAGIVLRLADGKLKIISYDANLANSRGLIYEASVADFGTRFTLVIDYSFANGLMTVNVEGLGNTEESVYSELVTATEGFGGVCISVPTSTPAGFDLYSAYIENTYDASVGGAVSFAPTYKDFEGGYRQDEAEWDCTHDSHSGEREQSVTTLYFDDGVAVTYSVGETYSNTHGASAYVETDEHGNKYLKIVAPKRVSSRDRAHIVSIITEKTTTAPNSYVFEMSAYFDSSSARKGFMQITFTNEGKYVTLMMDDNSSAVYIQGVKVGSWDKWLNLRFEYHHEQGVIQIYENGNFKGTVTNVYGTHTSSNRTVTALGGAIGEVSVSGVNDYGGFVLGLDNLALYSSEKQYSVGVISAILERFESKFTVDNSGVAPNIRFESDSDILYGGATNASGSFAEVREENGNHYVHIENYRRVNSNDRGYNVNTYLQNVEDNANAYVFETRMRIDSWSTTGFVMQFSIWQDSNNYGQYNIDNTKEYFGFGGVKIANWDEWFTMKIVHYPEAGVMQVYAKADGESEYQYRGSLGDFTTSNGNTACKVANIKSISRVFIGGYNSDGDAIYDLDDMVCYNARLDYVDMSEAEVEELPAPSLKGPRPQNTVKFDVDGTIVHSVTSYKTNFTVSLPATTPTKVGYSFDGWYLDKDTWQIPFTTDYFMTSEVVGEATVYAKFTALPEYKITYLVDGEEYSSESYKADAFVTLPASPTKEGYTFEGWYLDEELSERFGGGTRLTEDVTVYAKFSEIEPEEPEIPDEPVTPPVTPDEGEADFGDEIPEGEETKPSEDDFGDWY